MKRVFIIHGWGGYPNEGWFLWLKKELKKFGFKVFVPAMPNTENPKINAWVSYLDKLVGVADKDIYFIGHSIGCQAILRYIETLNNKKVGGAVLVAGWFKNLTGLDEDEKNIVEPWLKTKINFKKIKKNCPNITAIFSDNDPYVSSGNKNIFNKELNAKILIEHNKGHFSDSGKIKKLPIVLKSILKLT